MNKRALKILEGYLYNNEDYEFVELSNDEFDEIKSKCVDILVENDNKTEDQLWYEVETRLNGFVFSLGYKWNEDTYKYYK